MKTLQEHGEALLSKVWADIQRANQSNELDRIKADPDKHRLTRLMSPGAGVGYRYCDAGERVVGKTRKEKTRYCRASHKNAAGVYLIWRQVDRYKIARGKWQWFQTERFDFQWAPTRGEAADIIRKKANAV